MMIYKLYETKITPGRYRVPKFVQTKKRRHSIIYVDNFIGNFQIITCDKNVTIYVFIQSGITKTESGISRTEK